ncbi:hypothetical protein RCL1_002883 [Eukaryota sp. TZLM3-RCL]
MTLFSFKSRFEDFYFSFWSDLVDSCVDEIDVAPDIKSEIRTHVEELLEYNISGGKLLRGLTVVDVANSLSKLQDKNFSDEVFHSAAILGWVTEILQAAFLVADDVMDNSKTRRGKPSWQARQGVGLAAVNDAFLLESIAYKAIDHFLPSLSTLSSVYQTLRTVSRLTEWGQFLDTLGTQVPIDLVSKELFTAISVHKTSFYTFFLPCCFGVLSTGTEISPETFNKIREVCKLIGIFFQFQDDYLDVFGDFEVLGKPGTDLIERKAAWPLVKTLEKVPTATKHEIDRLLNTHDVESVKKIMKEVDIPQEFSIMQDELLSQINSLCLSMKSSGDDVQISVADVVSQLAQFLKNRSK